MNEAKRSYIVFKIIYLLYTFGYRSNMENQEDSPADAFRQSL